MGRLSRWGCGLALCSLLAGCQSDPKLSYEEWRVYSGDLAGTKFSELDQIDRTNVQLLKPAWIFRTGDRRERPPSTIECNPIVVDGVIYLTSPGLKVIALDAAVGKKIWQFDPFAGAAPLGVNRGVTYWEKGRDKRIFFVAGSFLYSLEAGSGEPDRGFGVEGRVDLRQGLDREVSSMWVTATSPGIVYEDLLIIGSAVGEGPAPAAPGHVRAYDARSGQRVWIFHTIPHPGEPGYETWPPDAWKRVGGANAWGGFTLDAARGLLFFGTGSPSYDHYGGDRPGANLFANSIVALEAATGRLIWHFQTVHHDLWDYDLPCPPNLVTVRHEGHTIDAVAQVTKMGHLFLLDRQTGRPLFPVEEREVPSSDIEDEVSWPTQPFPTKPRPYAKQTFTREDITQLSAEAHADVLERFMAVRSGSIFLPPSREGSLTLPQFNGGTDWGGAAFDPATGILYVNASNDPELITMVPSRIDSEITTHSFGRNLYGVLCSGCHGWENTRNPGSPSLTSLRSIRTSRSREEVYRVIEKGRGQMPSFAVLSEEEKSALVAFLWNQGGDEAAERSGSSASWRERIRYVATGHQPFLDPDGYPAIQPPWGTLSAIDLNQGEILWQVPLGEYPELLARGLPPTGTFNMGGPMVTAGGLVFIGATKDEKFRAFDKETGKVLWEWQLDAGAYATPATYEVDGTQYVLVAAGGGGKPETRPGDAFYCFTLPKTAQPEN